MAKYKCILWDWNGTLLDDMEVCINVMNRVLNVRKLPLLDIKRYKEIFGFPIINYYNQLGFDFNNEQFENISTEFITEYQRESLTAKLTEYCIETLEFIKGKGIMQIILSASQLDNLREQVNHFGVAGYFDELLGLDHCHATSKIDIGKAWMKESGYNKNEILLVGDTVHDYEVACELGCDCVLVSNGHQKEDRLLCLGIPVINSLEGLARFLI